MRNEILNFMKKHCYGYRNAMNKGKILAKLKSDYRVDIPEREFRRISSDLKKENLICSLSSAGYWFHPLFTNDPAEIDAIKASWEEMKKRGLNIMQEADKNIKTLENRRKVADGSQSELPLSAGR